MEAFINEPITAIAALGTALVAAVVLHTIVQWHRLSHVPGPFWAAFSKCWMIRTALEGRQPEALKQANDKYGMFMSRVARPSTHGVLRLRGLTAGGGRLPGAHRAQ